MCGGATAAPRTRALDREKQGWYKAPLRGHSGPPALDEEGEMVTAIVLIQCEVGKVHPSLRPSSV